MLILVDVALHSVRRRQVCFVRRQQILAVLEIVAPTLTGYYQILWIVHVEVLLVMILMEGFAHLQLILAVSMHHAPPKMVLLSIPKVVRAARVIARLLPMVCFAHLQQILAVRFHYVPLLMVLLSIPKAVPVEPTHVQLHQEFTQNVQVVNVQHMVP